jgi:uncharacterized integral membrane protein (TIGR00698 family)
LRQAIAYAACSACRNAWAILIACGNSICGNWAIAAVAPVIGADGNDIASSISFTAVLGVVVVLTLPLLAPILHLSLTQYGVLAGLTVYAVPQVLAATLPIGALSNQVGTVIKLVRVLMLGPVVLGFSLFAGGLRPAHSRSNRRGPRFREMIPWFITGFLALLLIRSLGLIPAAVVPPITHTAALLTTIAMAGLGLGVDLRTVVRTGLRVTLAVTVSLLVLGVISSYPDIGNKRPVISVQPEFAVDGADLGRLDQPRMGDRDRVQRALKGLQPEIQELVERRKRRTEVIVLPDVGL